MSEEAITSDIVREARLGLFECIEEISGATGLLRESIDDLDNGNSVIGAALCADDALEIISRMETKFSEIAAELAKWIAYAQQEGGAA